MTYALKVIGIGAPDPEDALETMASPRTPSPPKLAH
jgi:hypothetical protein